MDREFDGLGVVVTGGTGALGSAVVARLLAGGARCVVPVFKADELRRFPFAADPRVRVFEGIDLCDEPAVERFYEQAAAFAPLWASLHVAGGFAIGPAAGVSKAEFMLMMQSNALTCFLCSREAVKRMRLRVGSSPAPAGGRIVNVAARPGVIPELGAGMVAYTASKAAVAAITQSLAAEVVADGILVNAVVPSIMDTHANRKAMPDADHAKWPKVEDVAATICFLASPRNSVTRGALVPVYGKS
ncbi:MAG: SDR family NAD(P)-dependent oxidoreductase [Phycisphaerales bacterium]